MRRIVIKLGTNTLCDADGLPDAELMAALAQEVHDLRTTGHQVLIVSSGAIGFGRAALKVPELPLDIPMRQACAAVGQHRLMRAWDDAFRGRRVPVAQLLVTSQTFERRDRYVNLRNCIEALLKQGAVPVLNENDAVAIEEIDATFRDNDHLGALVAAKVEADLYVILSDVDGLYSKPPHEPGAERLATVPEVTDKVLRMAGKPGAKGRGGMRSKLESARYLADAGVPSVIAYGRAPGILHALLGEGPPGTWFEALGRRDGMERWLLGTRSQGRILVDEGAAQALRDGFHLLPAGVVGVEGDFPVESVVDIVCGDRVARAISLLSSRDLDRCKGMQSEAAREALGLDGPANVTRKGRIALG